MDALVGKPVRLGALQRGQAPAAASVNLAALNGENRLLAAEIARDDLEFRRQQIVQHHRKGVGLRSRAGACHIELDARGVGQRLYRRFPAHDAQRNILADRADPGELAHVIAGIAVTDERFENRAAGEDRHGGAIARRLLDKEGRGANTARAGHDLDDDIGRARNMASDVTPEQPPEQVNATARRPGGVDIDRAGDGPGILRESGGGDCQAKGGGDGAQHGCVLRSSPGDCCALTFELL